MIDSHCHLDHENLINNLEDIVKRSKDIGITKLLTICTTINSFQKIEDLVNYDEIIYGTFGIHPHETEKDIISKRQIINKIKGKKKIIGVGETGLDFYYNHSNKKRQISSFREHIEASIELNIPLIVHSRNAEIDTFNIINDYKNSNPKILMHCFTGSLDFAKKLNSLDAFFSASGIITFNKSEDLRKTFSNIPLDKILIETDSPYLAPVPMRGKKNEPSYIKYTAEKLAELNSIKFEKLIDITSRNFNSLFSSK